MVTVIMYTLYILVYCSHTTTCMSHQQRDLCHSMRMPVGDQVCLQVFVVAVMVELPPLP